jgi:type II secretory pathway pseudopilin PulG
MTNAERRSSNEKAMNANEPAPAGVRHCGFVIDSKLESPAAPSPALRGIRISKFREISGFTIIELLIVITIIIVLAALVISTMGYAQKKAARSRAEAEIAAMSAACESYKADNGTYPTDAGFTESVDPNALPPVPPAASLYLYKTLSGDTAGTLHVPAGTKTYLSFKPQMLGGLRDANNNLTSVTYIRDPFGNPYGYSTAKAANPGGTTGYNPTFDLWSTAGTTTNSAADQAQWIKNW